MLSSAIKVVMGCHNLAYDQMCIFKLQKLCGKHINQKTGKINYVQVNLLLFRLNRSNCFSWIELDLFMSFFSFKAYGSDSLEL
jgi:hypothetical protein